MQSTKTMKRHAALFDRMSQHAGFDMEEQVMRGKIDMPEIAEAVLKCTSCARPEQCEKWLSAQSKAEAPVPDYCRNRDLFRLLKT